MKRADLDRWYKETPKKVDVAIPDAGLTPEEIAVLDRGPEIAGETGDGCNPWAGPWVCTHCWAWWKTINIPHSPACCPGCGAKDGIKRRTSLPDGVWESHAHPEQ